MSIHPRAEQGFGGAAEEYERGRPDYPPAAIDWLADRLGLGPGRIALDVGAGTGKLTRSLVRTGAQLIALEPVPQMRSVLERQVPRAEVLGGRAEKIPLPEASVDSIVAGQAFHWFDGPAALAEFHRVLRSGRRLGLIWNRRDRDQPLHQAIDQIIDDYRQDTPAYHSDEWSKAFARGALFAQCDRAQIAFAQDLDAPGLVDRVMSISYVASLERAERGRVEERLRRLAEDGLEPLRHTTQIFVYDRLD